MRRPTEIPRFLFLAALLSMHALSAVGQSRPPGEATLRVRIPRFELVNETLADGIAKLSLESLPLAIGLEEVLRPRFSDPPVPSPRFSMKLEDKTVREVLDALCGKDSRYTWSRDGAVINIYPRATVGDPTYLLNRKLEKLELKGITDVEQGLSAIVQQLPRPKEQIALVQIGGDIAYPPQPWTATFEGVTVRQVINRLASHMDARTSWVFSGSKDFRAFSFFKRGFYPSTPER